MVVSAIITVSRAAPIMVWMWWHLPAALCISPGLGVVTLAEPDLFYSGGTIVVDHGYLLSSTFLHLSKVRVKVGDEVKAGDIIGEVGSTGRATGPHLDWRMNWRAARIDPQLLAPPMPKP